MEHKVQDNWYESFFSGINCEMWETAIPEEFSEKEADYLIEVMGVEKGANLLDMPCGYGRLAIPLANKGFNLTCIDISEQFLRGLDKKVVEEKLPIRVIRGNILTLEITGNYDGAYCTGNSFGYFDFAGMKLFVKKITDCLKPGARLIINSGMVAESILRNYPLEKTYNLGDLTMKINNEYFVMDSCMVSHLSYTKNGHSEHHSYKHYVYTIGEIKRLLASFDLQIIALHSGFHKKSFELGDQQVYIVCEKRN
ncbi:MAG TPA: class I SAM-dependent methyltransferase [Nitrosopumilaceae archaeon]|jgi:cyclopropane fatty-acyl-phospholipid synthase-like methyltransferase|nr:class I SAM-dependent methyltransferase [Nitrosopumilaceae archaeon]